MVRDDLRKEIIDCAAKTFEWMSFVGWSCKNKDYDLVKFQDNIDLEFIMWVYVHDEFFDVEFRKDAKIDKEFRNIKPSEVSEFFKKIQYIY